MARCLTEMGSLFLGGWIAELRTQRQQAELTTVECHIEKPRTSEAVCGNDEHDVSSWALPQPPLKPGRTLKILFWLKKNPSKGKYPYGDIWSFQDKMFSSLPWEWAHHWLAPQISTKLSGSCPKPITKSWEHRVVSTGNQMGQLKKWIKVQRPPVRIPSQKHYAQLTNPFECKYTKAFQQSTYWMSLLGNG